MTATRAFVSAFALTALAAATVLGGCGERLPAEPQRAKAGLPADAPAGATPGPAAKPAPPMDLDFWFDTPPAPGATVRVGLAVTPRTDLPDCELAVELPPNLAVVEGNRTWRGPVASGRRQALFLTLTVPDGERYELHGSALAAMGGGARLARTAELVVNGPAAPKAAAPAGVLKVNSRGERILELPSGPAKQ